MKKKVLFIVRSYAAIIFFLLCAYILTYSNESVLKAPLRYFLFTESDVFPIVERFVFQYLPESNIPTNGFHRFMMPVEGNIVVDFGKYRGIILKCRPGSQVVAGDDGTISAIRYNKELGWYMDINHGNGIYSRYANVSKFIAAEGTRIRRGQNLASVSKLHSGKFFFQLFINGKAVNPATAALIQKGI